MITMELNYDLLKNYTKPVCVQYIQNMMNEIQIIYNVGWNNWYIPCNVLYSPQQWPPLRFTVHIYMDSTNHNMPYFPKYGRQSLDIVGVGARYMLITNIGGVAW